MNIGISPKKLFATFEAKIGVANKKHLESFLGTYILKSTTGEYFNNHREINEEPQNTLA